MPNDDEPAEVAIERELLASGLGAKEAAEGAVPTIDMRQDDEACSREMFDAASSVGFFSLVHHGIAKETIDAAFEASAGFFAQPREIKAAQSPFVKDHNVGYEYMAQVRPSTNTADQKESLQITAREGAMDGRWPSHPGELEPAVRTLMDQAHALGCRVLSLLEPSACPSNAAGTLARSHTLWGPQGQCTLRLLHYPPVEKPEEMPAGYWRAGPHTDWCCVTLLFQRPGNEGLECAANPRATGGAGGGWLRVDPVEGGIAVNIGDMLGRWSNGRLLSNLHRVRMPTKEEATPPRPRYSIAFFMQADRDAVIESDGHEPITAGEYLLGRVRSNFEAAAKKAG